MAIEDGKRDIGGCQQLFMGHCLHGALFARGTVSSFAGNRKTDMWSPHQNSDEGDPKVKFHSQVEVSNVVHGTTRVQ